MSFKLNILLYKNSIIKIFVCLVLIPSVQDEVGKENVAVAFGLLLNNCGKGGARNSDPFLLRVGGESKRALNKLS